MKYSNKRELVANHKLVQPQSTRMFPRLVTPRVIVNLLAGLFAIIPPY